MAGSQLESTNAMSAGASVWIVAPLAQSSWTKKIDWYLNFQILRSEPHQPMTIAPEMQQLIKKFEVEVPTVAAASSATAPLMIASSRLLPNNQVVVVPMPAKESGSEVEWVTACHKVWMGLGKPRLRVFLPKTLTAAQFESRWPSKDSVATLELVSEPVGETRS